MALRIGINALYLIPGGVGGTEIYLRHLLDALAEIDSENQYFVFTNRETGDDLIPSRPNFASAPQGFRASCRPIRMVWEQTLLPLAARRLGLSVMLNPGFTAPLLRACPNVTVFHDLQHKRHPEYFRWFDLPFWRFFLWASAHTSRRLLADSEETRADLLRFYRLSETSVRTAPLGVDPRFFAVAAERQTAQIQPYVLCASTSHPHKNLGPLIEAFAAWRCESPGFRLIITGVRGFHNEMVKATIAALGLADAVELTGWLPREDLYALFRNAWAFVYPSTFEGFGLPVLEALAAGIPTACSSIEPLASIAGTAALQFDPLSPKALGDALNRVVSDAELRARLSVDGPARAAQFSWRRTAELTLDALVAAAGVS